MTLTAPKLKKWPFYMADLLLLGTATFVVYHSRAGSDLWWMLFLVVSVALGTWIGILPFLLQHKADVRFAESNSLIGAVEELNNLRAFTNQISFATAQWQVVQEQASNTVSTARQISERMTAEAKAFAEFMQKTSDSEKSHLRLEVEKLRRVENEWLQVMVLLLDHVYALYLAGRRSGQPNIIQQLSAFQSACRDVARKVGLVPFEASPDEPFNPSLHQLLNGEAPAPEANARITNTLAPGYNFQGQLIRNALVSV